MKVGWGVTVNVTVKVTVIVGVGVKVGVGLAVFVGLGVRVGEFVGVSATSLAVPSKKIATRNKRIIALRE